MEKLNIIGLFHNAEPHNYLGQDFAGGKWVNKWRDSRWVSLMKDYFMWKETLGEKQICSSLMLSTTSNVVPCEKLGGGLQGEGSTR